MKYLITGGCGFLGSNLAEEVLKRGDELVILDNLYRSGTEKNLEWLRTLGDFKFYRNDIRNRDDVHFCIKTEKPDVIYHVAGQVAMTTSLERPRFDFDINVGGTFNVLEAVKDHCPETVIVYSSTNKVYGDLEDYEYNESETRYSIPEFPNGLPESIGLDFTTPYGCSKGAADQYMKDWAKCFGLKTVVFRHSSIFGGRQFSTFDQGWIGWFVSRAVETQRGNLTEPFTIQGNGKQVRDVLFSEDIVKCYYAAVEHIDKTKGQSFNIGGGMENSLSILELFKHLESEMDIKLDYTQLAPRESDQKMFVADVSKAKEYFGWEPQVKTAEGLKRMIEWVKTI
ncbi:CDP-paratose 2-epimerase [Halobacteriovorax marinus]|uniref:CDP-paratose 2-epimerase n=1 Tax=Halobacteriovorax marinus TaxID=97084 RepID=A0A1Y5FB01_9BACT|nr:CDP-paratose 2-epimerase [Halobacteriovorax marinus]